MEYGFLPWVCLASFCISIAAETFATRLDLRRMQRMSDSEESVFSSFGTFGDLKRAIAYARDIARFRLIEDSFPLVFWLLLIPYGILGRMTESITPFLLPAAVLILRSILTLPLEAYEQFFPEKKHGFSKMTWKLFLLDKLKEQLLQALLFSGISIAGIWIYSVFSNGYLLFFFVGAVLLTTLLFFLLPWMMRLFFKEEDLNDPYLEKLAEGVLKKASLRLHSLKKINASLRTTRVNAFFSGFGASKRIILFDTLLETLTPEETTGVIAHEAAHCVRRHLPKLWLLQNLCFLLLFAALFVLTKDFFILKQFALPVSGDSLIDGALSFVLAFSVFESLTVWITPLFAFFSRRFEREADAMAKEYCEGGDALASALRKLGRGNLSVLDPHPFSVFLRWRHPPLPERIRNLSGF